MADSVDEGANGETPQTAVDATDERKNDSAKQKSQEPETNGEATSNGSTTEATSTSSAKAIAQNSSEKEVLSDVEKEIETNGAPPPEEALLTEELFQEALKKKGYKLDVCDTMGIWLEGEVIDVSLVTPEQPKIKVHYTHFHRAYDEWVSSASERIRPLHTHSSKQTLRDAIAKHKLMPKGAKPPVLDDDASAGEDGETEDFDEMESTACRCIIQ